MFKINQKTNKVFITKGDNADIELNIVDTYGKTREVFDDDRIILTVRQSAEEEALIQKEANGSTISLVPADTTNIPVGTYKYDIQLTTFTGKVYTIIPSAYFEVGEEITK